MNKINETIEKFSIGELTEAEANELLKELGAGFHLDSTRNALTAEDIAATTVGETPAEANGWGLLDSGTGTMDKVHVVNGKTVNVAMGEALAYIYIGGKRYRLDNDTLVEI